MEIMNAHTARIESLKNRDNTGRKMEAMEKCQIAIQQAVGFGDTFTMVSDYGWAIIEAQEELRDLGYRVGRDGNGDYYIMWGDTNA